MTSQVQSHLFTIFKTGNLIQTLNKQSEQRAGLSLVQYCVLRVLVDMPAASAGDLADAVGVDPSSLTQTLRRLKSKRLICITQDPKDSRSKLISITRSGNNAVILAKKKFEIFEGQLTFVENEINKVFNLLEKQIDQNSFTERNGIKG